jgi:acetyltransferase
MVRFGYFVVAHPRVKEVDINPLVINSDNIICLDARMVLHAPEIPDETLPKPALRPYPVHYVKNVTLKDHSSCILRPIRPEDEPVVSNFFLKLSETSTRARYGEQWKLFKDEITHEQLVTVCFNDYVEDFGLIAENEDEVVAVGRITKVSGDKSCGLVGLIVTDGMQGKGVGSSFFSHMERIAKNEGITTLRAEITMGNTRAGEVFARFGFTQTGELDGFTNWIKEI